MIEYHLDNEIVWNANASNMPMLGKVTGSGARFKAIGGVLKIVLYNIPAEADYLQFSATNQKITGAFDIDDASAANVTIATANTDKAGEKELLIDFSADYSENKVFYIPLPTGTINGFTFTLLDSELNEVFTKTSTYNLAVAANHLILGPALNCAASATLLSEDFSAYSANDVPSGTVSGLTYECTDGGGTTKIYEAELAGGTSPELLVGKSSGSFTVSGIECDGITKMTLTFKKNGNALTVSATSGITVEGSTANAGTKTITLTNSSLKSFDLTFTAGSSNVRIDDILLVSSPASFTAPSFAPDNDALTINVGSTTATTDFAYANRVDDLEAVALVEDAAKSWLSADLTGTYPDYTLTVTASSINNGDEDRSAIVILRGSGVTKNITVTQKTNLVKNPTVSVTPGDSKFTATWSGVANATSYVAYLRTSAGTPTDGTNITASITESAGVYSITDYAVTNDQEYYLYVKVNDVASGYEATSEYVEKTFTPAGAPKGYSLENPYTVAEAISAAAALGGGTAANVYVKGIVSKITTAYDSGYGNVSFGL